MNKKKIITIIVVCLITALIIGFMFFSFSNNKETNLLKEPRGVELDKNGFYKDLDKIDFPEVNKDNLPKIKKDDILQWQFEKDVAFAKENNFVVPKDKYEIVEMTAKNIMVANNIGIKNEGTLRTGEQAYCLVNASTDGMIIQDLSNIKEYIVVQKEKTEQVPFTLEGEEIGDTVTVTLKEDGYAKDVVYKIEILSAVQKDITSEKFIQSHIKEIQKIDPSIKDRDSFFDYIINLYVVPPILTEYITEQIKYNDYNPPKDLMKIKQDERKTQINNIGYTYEEYLTATNKTNEQFIEDCASDLRENIIIMKLYTQWFGKYQDSDYLKSFENLQIDERQKMVQNEVVQSVIQTIQTNAVE